MGVHDEPIWDGNGGSLDPKRAPQRDLLIALHVKMDNIVLPALDKLTDRQTEADQGAFTLAQERAILGIIQKDRDNVLTRKSLKAPVVAAVIALLALAVMAVQTVYLAGGMG